MTLNNIVKPVLYSHTLVQKRACYIQVFPDKRITGLELN